MLAVLARISLLDATAFLFAREHAVHRVLQSRDVIGVRDIDQRQRAQLGFAVADELAEGGVHGGDVAIEAREGHARLRLLEEGAEASLAFPLGGFRAQPLGDVADQGQELIAPAGDAMDRDLHLDPAPGLADQR